MFPHSWSGKRWFPWVSLLVLALLAWWVFDERPPAPPREVEDPPRDADYYLNDFTLRTTDEQGRWRYRLEAENMLHFPATEHWEFTAPRVQVYTEEGPHWYGVAERGRAWSEGEEIELQGDVRLWQPASAQRPATELNTADLYLRPQEHYAETQLPAELRQEQTHLEGVGARAYMDRQQIELLSNVRARYAPQPR